MENTIIFHHYETSEKTFLVVGTRSPSLHRRNSVAEKPFSVVVQQQAEGLVSSKTMDSALGFNFGNFFLFFLLPFSSSGGAEATASALHRMAIMEKKYLSAVILKRESVQIPELRR